MLQGTEPPHFGSLGRLRLALSESERHYAAGRSATVDDLLRPLGAETSALAAAMLALPFLSPVSMGALTAPASLLIALLGWRLLRAAEARPLPARLLALPVPRLIFRAMTAALERVHRLLQRFSRARHTGLVAGRRGRIICGTGIITGAVLLAVPVPLLPLTNTFPALAILGFGLGWAEHDGLLTILGAAALLVSILLFGAIGAAIVLAGAEALPHLLPQLGR